MVVRYRTKVTVTLDKELYERLKAVSKASKVPISRLIDEGIEKVLEERESRRN